MPRRKPKQQVSKEQELKIKKQLDDILLADEMLSGLSAPDIPPIKPVRMMNFDAARVEVESEAKNLLGSLLKFYLDDNLIKQDDFALYKSKIDVLSISTMAFAIRSAQHSITKLMDEIDAGGGGQYMARNYEVLAQLQGQLFAMPEKFQKYIAEMEKAYKNHADEKKKRDSTGDAILLNDNGEEGIPGIYSGGNVKIRGNKALMENIQNSIKKKSEYKQGEIVEEKNELVDPRNKDLVTPEQFNIKEEDDPGFDMDQDLF